MRKGKDMIKWAIKKYIIGKVNSLLASRKGEVDKVGSTLSVWIGRLERILACLKSMLAKLDDGKLDSEEVDQAVADVEAVIKEW